MSIGVDSRDTLMQMLDRGTLGTLNSEEVYQRVSHVMSKV